MAARQDRVKDEAKVGGAAPDPAALLAWYDRHARVLPWRVPPADGRAGVRAEPYFVWLSEVMLQQTTVAAVGPYFRKFVARWPMVADLAAAPPEDVLAAWAGLGYYARARNLHACAQAVVARHGGRFPADIAALRSLPGIGEYTAAAIAAIAFDLPAVPVDGNVERVAARIFAVEAPLPDAKPELRILAAKLAHGERHGDLAQALMDLGATICTPRKPRCLACPWRDACAARAAGLAEDLPRRRAKAERPVRRGTAFWAVRPDGAVLLRRRPAKGLLGGMMEIPSSDWHAGGGGDADLVAAPLGAKWRVLPGHVAHTFTHFHLELRVAVARVPAAALPDGAWVMPDALGDAGLPSVMKKIARHALAHV